MRETTKKKKEKTHIRVKSHFEAATHFHRVADLALGKTRWGYPRCGGSYYLAVEVVQIFDAHRVRPFYSSYNAHGRCVFV